MSGLLIIAKQTLITHQDDRDLSIVVEDGYISIRDCEKTISELECVPLKSAIALHEMLGAAIEEIKDHPRYAQLQRERDAA